MRTLRTASSAGRLITCAGLLSIVACTGGGERGTGPGTDPGSTGRAVARVAIASTSAGTLAPGETAVLTATALTVAGDTVRDAAVAWATSADAVVRLEAAGARVTATAAGSGTAVVSATAGGRSAEITLTVAAPRVSRLVLAWHHLAMPVGQALPLAAAATRSDGTTAPDPATTYRSTNPAVATVAGGAVTGVAVGTALVVAELGDRADTAAVTVAAGAAALALDARELAPGAAVRLSGPAVSGGVQVTIGGAAVATATADDGVALTVPSTPFAPCLAPGQRLTVAVTVGGGTATLGVPARETPLPLTLAAGQHAIVTDAIARGCSVELQTAGDYTVAPFTWDRTDRAFGYMPPAPLATRLWVTPGGAPGSSERAGAAPVTAATAGRGTGWLAARLVAAKPDAPARWPADWHEPRTLYAGRSASVAAATAQTCGLPAAGGTVPIYTKRGPDGVYQAISVAGQPEPWTVAATSSKTVALYDSTMARVAQTDPAFGRRLGQFLAAYDSTVAPLFDQYAGGMPDLDGNGKLIIMLPYNLGSNGAVPTANTFARSDCDGARSEAILLPSGTVLHDDRGPGQGAEIAAHEGFHALEFSLGRPQGLLYTWWSTEGLAVLFEHLWAATASTPDAPLTSNFAAPPTRTIEGAAWGPICQEPVRSSLPGLVGTSAGTPQGYRIACQFTSYVFQRGLTAGVPLPELVQRWMNAKATGGRLTFAQTYNTVLRTDRSAADVVGAWLLSWVADDRVPGTDAAVQDRALHLLTPARDATIPAGHGGVFDATLAESDGRIVDLPGTDGGTRVRYGSPDGTALPANRTALAVLRLR